jgi:hypothetical protein
MRALTPQTCGGLLRAELAAETGICKPANPIMPGIDEFAVRHRHSLGASLIDVQTRRSMPGLSA